MPYHSSGHDGHAQPESASSVRHSTRARSGSQCDATQSRTSARISSGWAIASTVHGSVARLQEIVFRVLIPGGPVDVLERQQYDADGYVVREGVFTNAEIGEMVAACEQLVADLVSDRQGRRIHAGSYVFDPDVTRQTMIKWEGDSDIVHGIEPFAHLSPVLNEWAHDPRFLDLARDVLGAEPMLFTEKLNLKRPRHGGVNPMHQDHPYWVGTADDADRVMTIMLMLDDATLANGCLHVVPGSHKAGEWDKRSDTDVFGQNEIDYTSLRGRRARAPRDEGGLARCVRSVPGAPVGAEHLRHRAPRAALQLPTRGLHPHPRHVQAEAEAGQAGMTAELPPLPTATLSSRRPTMTFAFFAENGYVSVPRITTDEEVEWLGVVYDLLFEEKPARSRVATSTLPGPTTPRVTTFSRRSWRPNTDFPSFARPRTSATRAEWPLPSSASTRKFSTCGGT